MNSKFSYRWLMGAFIALFFALQSYGTAHASAYGDAPHEHDGVACSITVLSDEDAIVLPNVIIPSPEAVFTAAPRSGPYLSTYYLSPQGRAPPPRGPPSSI